MDVGCRVELWRPWRHAPIGRRCSTPRPVPSARQRDWPAGLSERRVGLLHRYFGCDLAPAYQVPHSPPSTSHCHCSSLCGCPAATALRLFPRGWAATGEMGAPTSDAPLCVTVVALRVAEALAALILQRAFRSHVRLHRHSQAAQLGERSYLGNLGATRH